MALHWNFLSVFWEVESYWLIQCIFCVQDMLCSFFSIIGYAPQNQMKLFSFMFLWIVEIFFLVFGLRVLCCYAEIHPRDFFAMLRVTPPISSVWLLSCGLLQLLLLFIALLLDTKLMLKIWSPCFTCMFGVCICLRFYKVYDVLFVK